MTNNDFTKERYQLVTHRQEYHADRMETTFTFYIKVYTSLVIAGITLASQESPLKLDPVTVPLFLYTIASLISLVGVVSIVQIIMSLISWKGYRDAQIKIDFNTPPVPGHWWLFETLYCVIILISLIISWFGVKVLLDLIQSS